MKLISKSVLTTLAVLLLVILPACRTKKKTVTPAVVPTTTESAAPEIPPPPTLPSSDTVDTNRDFVKETPVTEEIMPTEMNALNDWARQKGYIRDAFFNYDEGTLDDTAQAALSGSAAWLKGKDGATYNVLIEGHCDERGTEQYNLALGDRRANTAKEYLVTLGVDAGRIRTVSYGEERPFEEGHDDASWAQNRRAHIVLVR